ncbi:hypothetical protein [Sinorhizobium fredii]|uniref:Uncharacterized protein n=1 Tax=Rhizobium fredii TaxID=380 RepID=A0A2A6M671_RHIFR|nr:hypothetical protein [Sinorhizobium fredii]PDT50353.1 hypothetical protein CO661_01530 [Sinorhizobium fredii]
MKKLSSVIAASLLGLAVSTIMPLISSSSDAYADNGILLIPGEHTGSSGSNGDTGAPRSNPDTGTPSSNPDTGTPSSNPDTGAPSANPDNGTSGSGGE